MKTCDELEEEAIIRQCGTKLDNAATYLKLAHEQLMEAGRGSAPYRKRHALKLLRWANRITDLYVRIGNQAQLWDEDAGE